MIPRERQLTKEQHCQCRGRRMAVGGVGVRVGPVAVVRPAAVVAEVVVALAMVAAGSSSSSSSSSMLLANLGGVIATVTEAVVTVAVIVAVACGNTVTLLRTPVTLVYRNRTYGPADHRTSSHQSLPQSGRDAVVIFSV
jgi:hypothetical protein